MSISPKDVLNKNKNLNKRIGIDKINLDNVTIDDLKFNGNNYEEYVNLQSLLENVSACQISDAYNGISRRSGVIPSIKPVNNKKVWGSIYTAETSCDDWGTSALAIDGACEGDILFFKVDSEDMHLGHMAERLRRGFYGDVEWAIIEVSDIVEGDTLCKASLTSAGGIAATIARLA